MKIHKCIYWGILFLSTLYTGIARSQSGGNPFGYSSVPSQWSALPHAVGSINGNFFVTDMGAACYSMDIEVPKGIAGLQPELGLVYNSQVGNGILGDGFCLKGTSVITRGPKDIFHDGKAGGIAHTMTDNFFLDGQRLVLVGHTVGSDSAEYCLELNPFTRIILHGLNGSQSQTWFSVQLSNGRKCQYGKDGSQQVHSAGEIKADAWYVNRVEDAIGNSMTYSYTADSLCLYLSSISYGVDSVSFVYGDRPDVLESSIEGTKICMRKRLTSILAYNRHRLFRQYHIYYYGGDNTTLHHSRIGSVYVNGRTMQFSDGFPSTQFSWNYLPAYSCLVSTPLFDNSVYYHGAPRPNLYFFSADLNGDGLTDIAEMINGNYGYGGNPNKILIHYSSIDTEGRIHFRGNDIIGLGDQANIIGLWKCEQQMPLAIDIDGDGVNELLAPEHFSSVDSKYFGFRAYKGSSYMGGVKWPTINATNSEDILCCAADFNNDGICEIAALDKTRHNHYAFSGVLMGGYTVSNAYYKNFTFNLQGTPQRMFAADMNCDGLTDIVVFCEGGYTVFWNDNTWLDDHTTPIYSYQDTKTDVAISFSPQNISIGDFNGDGIADFLMRSSDSGRLYFGLGNGDGDITLKAAYTLWDDNVIFIGQNFTCSVYDMDGDGLSDAVVSYANGTSTCTNWLRSNGNQFELQNEVVFGNQSDAASQYYVVGDFDGNGLSELGTLTNNCYTGGTSSDIDFLLYQSQYYHIGSGKVNTITDGFGNRTQIVYKSLTDTTFYKKEHDAVFPVVDLAPVLACVASVTEDNGAASDIVTTYGYKGLKGHLQGRGLLGLTETMSTNNLTGFTETTTVIGRDAHTLLPEFVMKRQMLGDSVQWQETDYHIDSVLHNRAYNYYVDLIESQDFDRHQEQTTHDYSPFTGAETQYYHHRYDYTSDHVHYGDFVYAGGRYLPQSVLTVREQGDFDGTDSVRTCYEYNNRGLITKRTDYANTSQPVITMYSYDAYGNIISETTSATGVETITKTYEYTDDHRFMSKSTERGYIVKEYEYQWDYLSALIDKMRFQYPQRFETIHDIWGRLQTENTPEGGETTYYWGWGNSRAKKYYVLKQGKAQPWIKTWYDSRGREVLMESVSACDMPVSRVTNYDSRGRISSIVSTSGNIVTTESFTYDNLDRMLSRTLSDNLGTAASQTSCSYDGRHRKVTTTKAGVSVTRQYDPYGKLVSVTDPKGTVSYEYNAMWKPVSIAYGANTVTIDYDARGNRTRITDPDAGTVNTTYDAYGRVKTQTNPLGVTTSYTYDNKGRLEQVVQDSITTSYQYGTFPYNRGLLLKIVRGDDWIKYSYNRYGRLTQEQRNTPLGIRSIILAYDSIGQHTSTTYPGSISTQHSYDCYGYKRETLLNNSTRIWRLNSQTGSTVLTDWGGCQQWQRTVNSRNQTTQLQLLQGNQPLCIMNFGYDSQTDNLISRTGVTDSTESFSYDNMDRLTLATSGSDRISVGYSADGNLVSKTGIGRYYYESQRPHAVTSVDNTYGLIPTDQLDTRFNALGKVDSIIRHGNHRSLSFRYGPDDERWITRSYRSDTLLRTNLYMGSYEESILHPSGLTQQFYYLDGNTLFIQRSNGANELLHMLTDHQGTVVAIVDSLGNYRYQANFDPWGNQTVTRNDIGFIRGYTGHEMLPEFGLINMNGRMYDPLLGRFLSPDNYVQAPENSQNFNRYSYCLNNPLKYTDPSGQFVLLSTLSGFIRGIVDVFEGGNILSPITFAALNVYNDFKINWGLFKGNLGQITSRFTWELPQTTLGNLWSEFRLVTEKIDDVRYFDGATYVINDNSHSNKGVTIGSYININDKGSMPIDDAGGFSPQNNPLYMHEYGHYLQSQEYGWGYLISVGVPSLFSAWQAEKLSYSPYSTHQQKWFEMSANRKAEKYFREEYSISWDAPYVNPYNYHGPNTTIRSYFPF